jgi:hypothetical protein
MKLSVATAFAVLVAAALLVTGCGGSGSEGSNSTAPPGTAKKATAPNAPAGSKVVVCEAGGAGTAQLRATAIDCDTARMTMQQWEGTEACSLGDDDSRGSCSVGAFRCQAVKVDRGLSVSCAKPGGDVAFIAKD